MKLFQNSLIFIIFTFLALALGSDETCSGSCKKTEGQLLVDRLSKETADSYLMNHDFLQCFSKGAFSNMTRAIQIFAQNHYTYSRNFLTYMKTVHEKLEGSNANLIQENINEEMGNYEEEDLIILEKNGIKRELIDKIPHTTLIKKFLESIGTTQKDFENTETPGYKFTEEMINLYKNSNACEATAVIGFAIEQTVPTLYQFLWSGLKASSMNPDDFVFFPLHILVDDGHAEHLQQSFATIYDNDSESCKKVPELLNQVLETRIDMFSKVRKLIEDEQVGGKSICDIPPRVSQDSAVEKARLNAASLGEPGYTLHQKMALSARILAAEGQGKTLSGQITCKTEHNGKLAMYTQVYGKSFEEITPADFTLIDEELNPIVGDLKPNMATRFHLHVYKERPEFNCMVHTHPLYTSALGQTGLPLLISNMDHMALYDDISYLADWPGIPFGDEEGEIISKALGEKNWSIMLAHHGLLVGGRTIEEATYRAYFFERAAKMQLLTLSSGVSFDKLPRVDPAIAQKAHDWRINDAPVKAHFNSWARQILKNGENIDALGL